MADAVFVTKSPTFSNTDGPSGLAEPRKFLLKQQVQSLPYFWSKAATPFLFCKSQLLRLHPLFVVQPSIAPLGVGT